jgi:penicillin-binding protein 1A
MLTPMSERDVPRLAETKRARHGRWPFRALLVGLVASATLGALAGYFMRFDLPDVRALEDYNPPQMTRVVAADGAMLETFAEQRRILIEYRDIPQVFLQALIASEDANFYRHTGIDLKGVLRAAWRDLRSLRLAQGASTLTQQLARNLFLKPDKTIRRKVQEALLALEIERQYTKQEILGFYCNQIYMGHGRYGLEAASRFYFGVPARELQLVEAATLAGLIQRPEGLTPLRHPERAFRRRNYVLRRMVEIGVLNAEAAAPLREQPIELVARKRLDLAPHFVEEVRRWLQKEYRSANLYQAGYTVHTTLDPQLQGFANEAMDRGLRELDRRQGWRGVAAHVPPEEDPATWTPPEGWDEAPAVGLVHEGVVVSVTQDEASVRVGPYRGSLGAEQVKWTDETDLAKLLQVGDRIQVRLQGLAADGAAEFTLEQEPQVEAALVALDPSTGEVKALVGGFDYERSEFNRAVQARRQTGSAFKPFVYAAALVSGLTLADTLLDEPTVFLDRRAPDPYQPENYSNKYYETVTLRTALEKSANISTVKLLNRIGYDVIIDTARRLGIRSELRPYASIALGSFETTLMELTSAYSTFAHQGVRVEPHLVTEVLDSNGDLVERIEPEVSEGISPQIAYLMNRLLSGVITDGTGRGAASLGRNLAGKTGTTDDSTDAWFIGYSPDLAVGVWVGFDDPASLGRRETGARAALPIWRAFMEQALDALPEREFPMPPGLSVVSVDRRTGLRVNPKAYCRQVISEVFVAGTEPTQLCTVYEHQRIRLPYAFQRYSLNASGALVVPADELDALLVEEPTARVTDRGRRLEAERRNGDRVETVSIALEIVAPTQVDASPGRRRPMLPYDTTGWVGTDGRPARVVNLDPGRSR